VYQSPGLVVGPHPSVSRADRDGDLLTLKLFELLERRVGLSRVRTSFSLRGYSNNQAGFAKRRSIMRMEAR
jgi:hypothetical protein